jgi:hypothetical protein
MHRNFVSIKEVSPLSLHVNESERERERERRGSDNTLEMACSWMSRESLHFLYAGCRKHHCKHRLNVLVSHGWRSVVLRGLSL